MTRLMNRGASWSGRERNVCYLNLGGGRFADASYVSGLDFADDGRALVIVDWDGDGDLDLWFKNRTGPQLRFMRNELQAPTHFLQLELRGTSGNRDAVGARVEVVVEGRTHMRVVTAGDGYLSQSSRLVHFGLGRAQTIEALTVHWPAGGSEKLAGLKVDRCYRIIEGAGEAVELERRRTATDLERGGPLEVESTLALPVVLRTPLVVPPTIGDAIVIRERSDRATLLNLWAHWCEPCKVELREFARRSGELAAAGIDIVALSMDPPEDQATASAWFATEIAPHIKPDTFVARGASESERQALAAVLRHVLHAEEEQIIPTSLLVDPRGLLQVIYPGPVDSDRLLADVRDYALSTAKGARRALFPGRWYFRTPRDLQGLVEELRGRGLERDGLFVEALIQTAEAPPSGSR